jgi:hypothetical protein
MCVRTYQSKKVLAKKLFGYTYNCFIFALCLR